MDPAMSEDIEAVRDIVNRFMQIEVVPIMDGYEKRGEMPTGAPSARCPPDSPEHRLTRETLDRRGP